MSDPVVLLSTGDVVGPAGGVTDNSMVLFSGTSGKLIKGNNAQVTSAGLALLDDIDANAQLITLGLTTTQPQFDNSVKQATTEFVQRALGNSAGLVVLSASTALTAAHCGKLLQCFGGSASAITLPPSASLAVGAVIKLWSNATAPFVVYPQGADTITNGVTIPATVTVNTGDSVTFEYKGGGTWIMQGALQLGRASSIFGASLATSGYQKLPSGLIIQWGNIRVTDGSAVIVFPIVFPNNLCTGTCSATTGGIVAALISGNTSQFLIFAHEATTGTGHTGDCRWIAIGY